MATKEKGVALPPNWKRIQANFYLVRTQAGFQQALKDWIADPTETKKERRPLVGYPLKYPSVVCFSDGYRGYLYIRCDVIDVNTLRAAIVTA